MQSMNAKSNKINMQTKFLNIYALVMFWYFFDTFICIALLLFESGQCFFKGIFGQCFLISLTPAGLCFFSNCSVYVYLYPCRKCCNYFITNSGNMLIFDWFIFSFSARVRKLRIPEVSGFITLFYTLSHGIFTNISII